MPQMLHSPGLGSKILIFLSKTEWPPSSPDLNPLDYSVWANLDRKACSKPHKSLDSLLKGLKREWDNIPQEELRAAVLQFRTRMSNIVKSNAGAYPGLLGRRCSEQGRSQELKKVDPSLP